MRPFGRHPRVTLDPAIAMHDRWMILAERRGRRRWHALAAAGVFRGRPLRRKLLMGIHRSGIPSMAFVPTRCRRTLRPRRANGFGSRRWQGLRHHRWSGRGRGGDARRVSVWSWHRVAGGTSADRWRHPGEVKAWNRRLRWRRLDLLMRPYAGRLVWRGRGGDVQSCQILMQGLVPFRHASARVRAGHRPLDRAGEGRGSWSRGVDLHRTRPATRRRWMLVAFAIEALDPRKSSAHAR